MPKTKTKTAKTIQTPADVAAHFGADFDPNAVMAENSARLSHRVYEDTACGAWAAFMRRDVADAWTFRVGSIVEGIDAEVTPEEVTLPCTPADLDRAVKAVEDAAESLWNETHGCDACGPENDTGYRSINPNCASCHGEGTIL